MGFVDVFLPKSGVGIGLLILWSKLIINHKKQSENETIQ